jgi:hypothetical protein
MQMRFQMRFREHPQTWSFSTSPFGLTYHDDLGYFPNHSQEPRFNFSLIFQQYPGGLVPFPFHVHLRPHLTMLRTNTSRQIRPPLPSVIVSACLLPLSITILFTFYFLKWSNSILHALPFLRSKPKDLKRRILITSDDETTTFAFARLAHSAGHDVFVVDKEQLFLQNPLRYSNAVSKFIGIQGPRPSFSRFEAETAKLLSLIPFLTVSVTRRDINSKTLPHVVFRLIRDENISLWIPCESRDDSRPIFLAKGQVRAQTTCSIFSPTLDVTKLSNDYRAFSQHVAQLGTIIECPQTTTVTSRTSIHNILADAPKGQKFKLEKEVNRRHSGYSGTTLDGEDQRPIESGDDSRIVPRGSPNDTYSFVATLPVSRDEPWNMTEQLDGFPLTVSALVMNSGARAFIARVSSERETTWIGRENSFSDAANWDFVDPHSAMGENLLEFTRGFAAHLPGHTNTHLNLHFILSEIATPTGVAQKIHAMTCDFKASPLLAQLVHAAKPANISRLFSGETETMLFPKANQLGERQTGIYSFPAALLDLAIIPVLKCILLRASLTEVLKSLAMFLDRVAYWQEEVFDRSDPWPWIWRWFVEVPVMTIIGWFASWIPKFLLSEGGDDM